MSKKKEKVSKNEIDPTKREFWTEDTYKYFEKSSKILAKKYCEIPYDEILYDMIYCAYQFGLFHEDIGKEVTTHNTWQEFNDILELNYNLESVILKFKKGRKTEKIELTFDDKTKNLHSRIYNAIFKTHQNIRANLKGKKITNLGKQEVYAIKLLNQKPEDGSPSRLTELKIILGSKTKVFDYWEDLILVNPEEILAKKGITDIKKMFENHSGKF